MYLLLYLFLILAVTSCHKELDSDCIETPTQTTVYCTQELRPVCGCNGITYGNACLARAYGVKKYTLGECGK